MINVNIGELSKGKKTRAMFQMEGTLYMTTCHGVGYYEETSASVVTLMQAELHLF